MTRPRSRPGEYHRPHPVRGGAGHPGPGAEFVTTATRLSAARREQRFAAMRLVGATRKQVSLLAATESTVAAVLGVALGFGIFFPLRAPVAGIPFVGQPFFPAKLTLSLPDVLVVALGVAAAAAARLALHRVHISPLGVARNWVSRHVARWLAAQRAAGSQIVGVERADEAVRLADLPAARQPTVAVLGHEQSGIPPGATELLDLAVEIPVIGTGASLNVAVAGSRILYRLAGLLSPKEQFRADQSVGGGSA